MDSLTERVLGAIFEVSGTLGAGFLEKVYQPALLKELGLRGIPATAEASFPVVYKGHCVGEYFADILVEDALVVELKCVDRLAGEHTAQCLNYLRASGPYRLSSGEFPEAQSRVEAGLSTDSRFPNHWRRRPGKQCMRASVCPSISWTLH